MCVSRGTYLVTRTTLECRFLLRPDPVVEQIFLYCLGRAAELCDIQIHAVCVESNHLHMVVTDTEGKLSEFMHWLDRHVSLCLMEHYRRTHPHRQLEGIWSKQPFSATLLLTPEAILDKIVYTLTNPVKDGMVHDYRKWPGLCSRPGDWLEPERWVDRPKLYFKERPDYAAAAVNFVPPPQFTNRDTSDLVSDVEALIRDKQTAVRAGRRQGRRPILGVKAVQRADPFDAPRSRRPMGRLNPRLAAGGNKEAMQQGMLALRGFRDAYREAWHEFRQNLKATFPGGTYLMRRLYDVECKPLDAVCWCALAPG